VVPVAQPNSLSEARFDDQERENNRKKQPNVAPDYLVTSRVHRIDPDPLQSAAVRRRAKGASAVSVLRQVPILDIHAGVGNALCLLPWRGFGLQAML
jgi:hypothetical protein